MSYFQLWYTYVSSGLTPPRQAGASADAVQAEPTESKRKGKKGEPSKKATSDPKDSKPRKQRETARKISKVKEDHDVEAESKLASKTSKGKKPARSAVSSPLPRPALLTRVSD